MKSRQRIIKSPPKPRPKVNKMKSEIIEELRPIAARTLHKAELLKNPEFKKKHDKLQPKYDAIRQSLTLRKKIAERLYAVSGATNKPPQMLWDLPSSTQSIWLRNADITLQACKEAGLVFYDKDYCLTCPDREEDSYGLACVLLCAHSKIKEIEI